MRSFLGLVNYYGRFIPDFAAKAHCLHELLHKNKTWKWSNECERCFQELKLILSSSTVLVHYDSQLPLKVACDASPYGVGAVLAHVMQMDWRDQWHMHPIP